MVLQTNVFSSLWLSRFDPMHGSNNIIICNSDATFSQKQICQQLTGENS
jgi:hypothetical protein